MLVFIVVVEIEENKEIKRVVPTPYRFHFSQYFYSYIVTIIIRVFNDCVSFNIDLPHNLMRMLILIS